MKKTTGFFATVFIGLTLVLGGIPDAEAKRFGSSRSFGGKSSFGSPYRKSTTSKATRSASQQKAYNQNQTARQGMSRRGGLMGMLGGLALGGLLGSMFFGGAFENFNFMDILVFGGIAFLLYKLFAAKGGARQQPAYDSRGSYSSSQNDRASYSRQAESPFSNTTQNRSSAAGFDTDVLFNKNKNPGAKVEDYQDDADFEEMVIPAGFDQDDFLAGATGAFKDLQRAWDNRDLAEIRGLTTDKVFAEIQEQLNGSTESNQTNVVSINAELLNIKEIGSELEAIVLFEGLIKEDPQADAEPFKEVWHFMKSRSSVQPKWYLDGIQQLDD